MKHTINSRKFGEVTFFVQSNGGYIFVDLNKKPGTLGNQICDGGELMGNTISYHGDRNRDLHQESFEKICNNWFRKYRDNYRGIDYEN
jgi:hypothetical protein